MKAIIIDDEINCIKTLQHDLAVFCPDVDVIDSCQSGKEGLLSIKRNGPDLIFLDVEMPWMNGFEMLEILDTTIRFQIIFVTAYNQFAVKAFRVSAVDYLLKPVDNDDLIQAVAKARKAAPENSYSHISNLLHNSKTSVAQQRIAIPNKEGYEFIPVEKIMYCKASGTYTEIFIENSPKRLLSKSLGEVESTLPAELFERIHHSVLVNLSCISQYKKNNGSSIIMKNGDELTISKSKKEHLMIRLGLK